MTRDAYVDTEDEDLERRRSAVSVESSLRVTNPDENPRSAISPIEEEESPFSFNQYYESYDTDGQRLAQAPSSNVCEPGSSREMLELGEGEDDEGFGSEEEIGYVVGRVRVDDANRPRRERQREEEREEREKYRERERDRERRRREIEEESEVERGRRRVRPQVDLSERERKGYGYGAARESGREKEKAKETGFAQRVREKLVAVAAAENEGKKIGILRGGTDEDVDERSPISPLRRHREVRVVPLEEEEGADSVVIMPSSAVSERPSRLIERLTREIQDDVDGNEHEVYGGVTTSTLLNAREQHPPVSLTAAHPGGTHTRPLGISLKPTVPPMRPPRSAAVLDLPTMQDPESTSKVHALPYLSRPRSRPQSRPSTQSSARPSCQSSIQPPIRPSSRAQQRTEVNSHLQPHLQPHLEPQKRLSPIPNPTFLFRKIGNHPSSPSPPPPRPARARVPPRQTPGKYAQSLSPARMRAASPAWLPSPTSPVLPPVSAISSVSVYSSDSPVREGDREPGRPVVGRQGSSVSERIEELEQRVRASKGLW